MPEHSVDGSDFGVVVRCPFADDAIGCEQSLLSEPVPVASTEMLLRSFDERIGNSVWRLDAQCDVFTDGVEPFDNLLIESFCSIEFCERGVAECNCVFEIQFFHLMFSYARRRERLFPLSPSGNCFCDLLAVAETDSGIQWNGPRNWVCVPFD
jgi:hypothetical protein